MNVIPKIIHNIHSNAERKVFDLLVSVDLGNQYKAFHSLNVSEHQYKKWAELDFVIVSPEGLFVLEVKGGRVACKDGIWIFTDRYGRKHKKSEGPFKQSETGMYALRDKLNEEFSLKDIGTITLGWGVVFPDINFNETSPEMPADVICDKEYFKSVNKFEEYIKKLVKYWEKKNKNRKKISPDLRKKISKYLRPSFDLVPSLKVRVDDLYTQLHSLTNEQYIFLDAVEDTERIICTGGAGTGKSFLAVESAKRGAVSGDNVLFVARGEIFIQFIKENIGTSKIHVCSIEKLHEEIINGASKSIDLLVVDEGQDLMTMEYLDLFEKILIGGLDKGRWRWFMDPNNQAGIFNCYEPDADELLKSFGDVNLKLKRNCRNTEQIIQETELTTGADIGVTIVKGEGPPVHYSKVHSKKDSAEKLELQLSNWLNDDVSPGDIAILSSASFEKSSASMVSRRFLKKIDRLTVNNVSNFPINKIIFSEIIDFKGLERKFIAVVDSNLDELMAGLYVAMTRSHAGLWIAINELNEKKLVDIQKKNATSIIAQERGRK